MMLRRLGLENSSNVGVPVDRPRKPICIRASSGQPDGHAVSKFPYVRNQFHHFESMSQQSQYPGLLVDPRII